MNDIRMPSGAGLGVNANAVASIGEKRRSAVETGQALPPQPAQVEAESEAKVPESAVGQAVAELNSYVQSEKRDLFFSVEDTSGDMIVRVVDRESGELIRQIPNQVVLDLAAKVRQNEPLQLINMQG